MDKYVLEAEYSFSKKLGEKECAKIKVLTEKANSLFKSKIPKELHEKVAQITKLEAKKGSDEIKLNIVGGEVVTSHAAAIRLKKLFQQELGKEFKLGVRDLKASKYVIEADLPKNPLKEMNLPFSKVDIRGEKAEITLKGLDETALTNNLVDRIISLAREKVRVHGIRGKASFTKIVKRSDPRLSKYALKQDPTPLLESSNWVKHAGRGVWTMLPPYSALFRAIEKMCIDKILAPMGFQEIYLPKITTLEVNKMKGQLEGIPNEMWYVCGPKTRDPEKWEQYKDLIKVTGNTHPEELSKNLDPPSFVLAYGQCEPFYDIWRGKVIDSSKLPIKLFDRNGDTYRYESGGLKGLERLNEFNRTEIVYLGTKEQVIEIRDKVKDKALEIIDQVFDLEWRIDSTTPVYLEHAGKGEEKEADYVKTYDLTVLLPFETASRPEAELEISSFHVHEDFYAKRFHWKEKAGRTLWSGCVGISPTRWAYVFVIRYGLDYNNWPKEVKKYIGKELPSFPEGLFV